VNLLVLNLLLGIGFMIALESFAIGTLAAGLITGYAALWVTQPLYGPSRYFRRVPKTLGLLAFFLVELVYSNLQVLWEVITPGQISRPGIVGVPLTASSELEILLVANLISLTPGTLSIDLSDDRRTLYVHVMFLDDPDRFRESIKKGLERRVLEVTR